MELSLVIPDLGIPGIRAACTTRVGGVSTGCYASMNLAPHTGDDPAAVLRNREILRRELGVGQVAYVWQIHGTYDEVSGMLSYEDGRYSIHTWDENDNETVSDEEVTKGAFMKEGEKLRWQDSKNDGDGVFVRLSDEETGDASVEAPVVGDDYISVLPDYIYKGGDPIMAAVTQYMIVQYKGNYAPCDVSIPCPVIVDKDETDSNDVKVWGNFWLYNYMMNGDTLVSESGGSYPGLMHLKSTDAGYEVTSFEVVADGSDYDESAKQIFGDRYDKFISSNADDAANQKLRAEIISDYVKSHELAITKYQDTGWDPVELPQ